MTHIQEKNQPVKTGPEPTQMLKLVDKDIEKS